MKKRIISATLALAMTIALLASLCVPSFASFDDGTVFTVCGTPLLTDGTTYANLGTDKVGAKYLKQGTIKVNGHTIVLKNVIIDATNPDFVEQFSSVIDVFTAQPAQIELKGNNIIKCSSSLLNHGIFAAGAPVAIISQGGGSLTIENNDICAAGLTINNATVNISNPGGLSGIVSYINSDDTYVKQIFSDFLKRYKANPSNYGVNIVNSNVNVSSTRFGIYSALSPIEISGSSYVYAHGETAAIASTDSPKLDVLANLTTRGKINTSLPIKADGQTGQVAKLDVNANNTILEPLLKPLSNILSVSSGETIATKAKVGTNINVFDGAAKIAEIGTKPTPPVTTPPTDTNTITEKPAPQSPGVNTNTDPSTKALANTATPKAAAIADTGESAIIIPVVAIIAVASVGAITFILRKKVTE